MDQTYSLPYGLGPFYSSPELALLLGNIFNFLVSFKHRLMLTLKSKTKLTQEIYEFSFLPEKDLNFLPGQYLEWTLNMKKTDGRGNRRFFTIASSPTEKELKLAVKIPVKSSEFKKALQKLKEGDVVSVSHLAGEFTLPKDQTQKLVFIAGGIGITPFKGILEYLLAMGEQRNIVLFYACKGLSEFVYTDILKKAQTAGVKTIYIETDKQGFLNIEMLRIEVPDYLERKFYISGPPSMVNSYQKLVKNPITDLFIGY